MCVQKIWLIKQLFSCFEEFCWVLFLIMNCVGDAPTSLLHSEIQILAILWFWYGTIHKERQQSKRGRVLVERTKFYQKLQSYMYLLGLGLLKFVYSEKATKFCEISTLLLSTVHTDKMRWWFCKILWPSQNMYMNFKEMKN